MCRVDLYNFVIILMTNVDLYSVNVHEFPCCPPVMRSVDLYFQFVFMGNVCWSCAEFVSCHHEKCWFCTEWILCKPRSELQRARRWKTLTSHRTRSTSMAAPFSVVWPPRIQLVTFSRTLGALRFKKILYFFSLFSPCLWNNVAMRTFWGDGPDLDTCGSRISFCEKSSQI